jgi:hypothetical protein
MAHTDSTPNAPGANDNASGVGVVTELAGRLERIGPACDVWLVATGAEERIYTGSPDHLGALALARPQPLRPGVAARRDVAAHGPLAGCRGAAGTLAPSPFPLGGRAGSVSRMGG